PCITHHYLILFLTTLEDPMAVYTKVDDEALESFLTLYNIGG
ncbi:MAG: hypothetical protein ACJAXQ_000631, partial [Parvibaculaceae bacterium]